MTTKQARDFLDKELFVKREIVTFRSLSRELGIHVNDAKDQLQLYHDAVRDTDAPAVPTYLVSGEVPALMVSLHSEAPKPESAMDMDLEFEEDREEIDVVYQNKVLLVDARTLDEAKSQFSRVHSVHIYSLSPSRFGDAGLLCAPSFKVHKADVRGGPKSFPAVGKVTGSHVKLRAGSVNLSAVPSSKSTLKIHEEAAPKLVAPVKVKVELRETKGKAPSFDSEEQVTTTKPPPRTESKDKLKLSGKLDWSKAKPKEKEPVPVTERTREGRKPKPEPDSPTIAMDSLTSKKPILGPTKSSVVKSEANSDFLKRGIKRKPLVDTNLKSESESPSAKVKSCTIAGSSTEKGVVYSDEDDDGEVRILGQRRPKRTSIVTSDSEMSLRAMMDIDDDQVDCVSRASKIRALREESEESEEEGNTPEKEMTAPPVTEEEESDHVPVVPRKKKPRKVVPVGRNGLKKRRVIKSRMTTDAKGYMQTEDYSSYESVEEEEEEETGPKPKGRGRETKKASEPTGKVERAKLKIEEEGSEKPKAKSTPKPRGAPKRGGLLNFFGPERGKK